ncbi:hypothetical protein BLNAU_17444 [Blattamonas nauphoetae]|uniref:Protein kinase domain-containing protein n=1 Tax=Blattamonas nauphoetae TaxID=2049346 RepID=A0ABQ9X744_9EUKA|nr:hypothetical protein BLNAU_17444 [Blattamonas nauphoetae]
MLTIAESALAVSPSSSPILVLPSDWHSSMMSSSVVVQYCSISNDVGSMRGVVETSSFPSFGESVSMSIVGCSFDSSRILGNDGTGLSLTRTHRKNVESVGKLSSSLIGCWFVNMTSIGSSHSPRLPHLDQKMLGCVVTLTSSHLSGSTIRDVNTVGCVLCSNSSFSSLLSSPNTDPNSNEEPSIILPDGSEEIFEDGKKYSFGWSENTDLSVSFSHCDFTNTIYASNVRPLTFDNFEGSITLLSCSFDKATQKNGQAGAVYIYASSNLPSYKMNITSCNFTECSAKKFGGGLYLFSGAVVTVTGCRCVECSITGDYTYYGGGGMYVTLSATPGSIVSDLYFEGCTSKYCAGGLNLHNVKSTHDITCLLFKECSAHNSDDGGLGGAMNLSSMYYSQDLISASFLTFEDCSADSQGAGLNAQSNAGSVALADCKFIRCKQANPYPRHGMGGGLYAWITSSTLTLTGCQFIDCATSSLGGAVFGKVAGLVMSECLVKNCSSKTSGAVCIIPLKATSSVALQNVLFVGNTVSDTPTYFDLEESMEGSVQFADFLIEDKENNSPTDVTITDCWTTTTPNSVGMYTTGTNDDWEETYVRVDLPAFNKIGPYLEQKVETVLDVVSWRIDLSVKGKIPLESQVYTINMKEAESGTVLTGQLKFVNGIGSLVPSSNLNLKFSTAYTITSIVGVVPSSSELNAIIITAEAWAFNLASTPSFLSFTTPDPPPCLTGTTAYLLSKEPEYAYIVVVFNETVSGSFDIVVEERGKDETITVEINESAKTGESDKFVVVGDERILTHDTSYIIKSIFPTPGTESTTTPVRMMDTITFHIPKSSYVPPVKDDKKTMSPEMKALLSWLIPLVACLLLALVVLIVVFVLVYRRKKKNPELSPKEMEESDPVQVEDKMDLVNGDSTNQVIHSDGISHSAFDSSSDHLPTFGRTREGEKAQTDSELVEVMMCNGGFEISAAPMTDTLYSVLHKEHREIGKRAIGVQIVNGLKQVTATRGWSDVLTRLSSHWILIDTAGNVKLKLEMNASEAEQEALQTQTRKRQSEADVNGNERETSEPAENKEKDKTEMDGMRWRAPEVVSSKGGQVDGHKAAVFSLGLVLWEIETGQVPFRELDAVNAQRQSGTGIGPKMDSLKNAEFVSLIHRCVSVDPEQRPTLSEIGEFLSSHPDETVSGSGNEMKE